MKRSLTRRSGFIALVTLAFAALLSFVAPAAARADTLPPTITISNLATTATPHSLTVSWDTDVKATSHVDYDIVSHASETTPVYAFSHGGRAGKHHSVTIKNLTPNTPYYVRVWDQAPHHTTTFSTESTQATPDLIAITLPTPATGTNPSFAPAKNGKGLVVSWTTSVATTTNLKWDLQDDSAGNTWPVANDAGGKPGVNHSVKVEGLVAGTTYFFQLSGTAKGKDSKDYAPFTTVVQYTTPAA